MVNENLYLCVEHLCIDMKTFCRYWLPALSFVLMLLIFTMVLLQSCGYHVYIVNSEKYPWVVNQELIARLDTTYSSTVNLLNGLQKEGLVLSPQEFTNHTHSFFSWLLTVLVAVIGLMALAFGYNVDKRIKESVGEIQEKVDDTVDKKIKSKWLELMRVDKEVDSTIGGMIDDKIEEAISSTKEELFSMNQQLRGLKGSSMILENKNIEE